MPHLAASLVAALTETKVRCLYPGDCALRDSVPCTASRLGAASSLRRRSIWMYIPVSRIVPSAPHRRSNWDCAQCPRFLLWMICRRNGSTLLNDESYVKGGKFTPDEFAKHQAAKVAAKKEPSRPFVGGSLCKRKGKKWNRDSNQVIRQAGTVFPHTIARSFILTGASG